MRETEVPFGSVHVGHRHVEWSSWEAQEGSWVDGILWEQEAETWVVGSRHWVELRLEATGSWVVGSMHWVELRLEATGSWVGESRHWVELRFLEIFIFQPVQFFLSSITLQR